jgi:hypothetical protein
MSQPEERNRSVYVTNRSGKARGGFWSHKVPLPHSLQAGRTNKQRWQKKAVTSHTNRNALLPVAQHTYFQTPSRNDSSRQNILLGGYAVIF